MTALGVTGLGVVAASGVGLGALADAAARPPPAAGATPVQSPFRLEGFDVRDHVGRRGTVFFDRCTGIAVVAAAEAIEDSGLGLGGDRGARIGVGLGTTSGSLRSMSDYTHETLVADRPYLVNPGLFPNTVMNCSSAQVAIRHGLRGMNTTVAGGQIAFFGVLRLAARALRLGHADAMLTGAVEEFSAQRAWQVHHARRREAVAPVGEGAAVLVLERADAAARAGRHVDARLESVVVGFDPDCPAGEVPAAALERCVARALGCAGIAASEVAVAVCCEPPEAAAEDSGRAVARSALGRGRRVWPSVTETTGECGAATVALHVAALLGRHRRAPASDGRCSLVAAWTPEGGVGAAVLRGFSRTGDERSAA